MAKTFFNFEKNLTFISKSSFFLLKMLKDLRFAIFILFLISFISSIGSIIEQDQDDAFYIENYSANSPLYGFLTFKFIFLFQLNHLYQAWYFLFLLCLLALSLILCSIYNQWPLLKNARKFFFSIKSNYLQNRKELIKINTQFFESENLLLKVSKLNFYLYQNTSFIYAYKALIGRISPIFVHISLVFLLFSSLLSSFESFKSQEILPKGEVTRVQNLISTGNLTFLPKLNIRVNDFWINYQNKKIKQFYSNLSLTNNYGKEKISKTISVNHPLIYNSLNIYQSDWSVISLRVSDSLNKVFEYPFFTFPGKDKIWLTWISSSQPNIKDLYQFTLVFDQLRNTFLLYDLKGDFIKEEQLNFFFFDSIKVIDFVKASGLLVKYDPTIYLIYLSFFLLIFSTFLSFLPYQRLSIYKDSSFLIIIFSKNNDLTSSFFFNKNLLEIHNHAF
jgi:cytochrome c biogenesis protein